MVLITVIPRVSTGASCFRPAPVRKCKASSNSSDGRRSVLKFQKPRVHDTCVPFFRNSLASEGLQVDFIQSVRASMAFKPSQIDMPDPELA